MRLRVCRLQRAITAIGMFSIFESFLQDRMGWDDPFKELPEYLKKLAESNLLQLFLDYKDAINVLKHGKGSSYTRLLKKAARLEFRVKLLENSYFEEGDVSEVQVLIKLSQKFGQKKSLPKVDLAEV